LVLGLSTRKLRSFQFKNSEFFADDLLRLKTPADSSSKDKSKKSSKGGLGDLEFIFKNVRELDLSNCSKVASVPSELNNIQTLILVGSSLTDEVRSNLTAGYCDRKPDLVSRTANWTHTRVIESA
jgi:hypothetical protein